MVIDHTYFNLSIYVFFSNKELNYISISIQLVTSESEREREKERERERERYDFKWVFFKWVIDYQVIDIVESFAILLTWTSHHRKSNEQQILYM